MSVAAQDIDSGTGEIITPGEPVDHTDMLDGQSAGHSIEPEVEDPPAPKPDVHEPGQNVTTKPGELSREDIYSKAKETRDIQDAVDAEEATTEQRAHIARMNAEAAGMDPANDNDPFDGDGNLKQGWVDTGAAPVRVTAAAAPIQNAPPALDPNAETVTIIVYGEKREVPKAEIDAAGGLTIYQKGVAADERMRRISTYEASLRSFDQELQTRAANAQQPQATGTTADPAPPPTGEQGETVDVQGPAEKLVAAMYSGDREAAITEAVEVFTSFKDDVTRSVRHVAVAPVEQGPTQQEQLLAQQRAAVAETDRLDANTVFVNEFSDLQSGVLRDATYRMVQTVAAEPIMYGRPLAEITREAGMRVRSDVYGEQAPPPELQPAPNPAPVIPAAPGTDLAQRMALKSRTVVQPLIPASGRFTDTPAQEQKTESNSDYINRMRVESRGQPRQ